MMWAATLMVMKIYSDVDVHVLNLLLLPTLRVGVLGLVSAELLDEACPHNRGYIHARFRYQDSALMRTCLRLDKT